MATRKARGERVGFSRRLQACLRTQGISIRGATRITREFNSRYGGKPVSVHAIRKWISGESIPTQDKLRALAWWLGVSSEWLRFGSDVDEDRLAYPGRHEESATDESGDIAAYLPQLEGEYKRIVLTLIHGLIDAQR